MDGVIIGQSGGPTAVINASLAGCVSEARKRGCKKILGMKNGIKGLLGGSSVDLNVLLKTEDDIEKLKRTPASALGSCRFKLPDFEKDESVYRALFSTMASLKVDSFLYIGGNDSMDTIEKLARYGKKTGSEVRFVGIPKTIDNDLSETDHSPGFGSAAKFIATTVREIAFDCNVYDVPSLTIVEIMGRNAGWLAASSVLAKSNEQPGADLIYLPETPFSENDFLEKVKDVLSKKNSVVAVISEGIRRADGKLVCALLGGDGAEDAFGHSMLSGAGKYLEKVVSSKLGIKCRSIELSTVQRCAAHCMSVTDMNEAFSLGKAAVRATFEGKSGVVPILRRVSDNPYSCETVLCEVEKIANKERTVPKDWITNGFVSEKIEQFVRPLIQGEVFHDWTGGLPSFLSF